MSHIIESCLTVKCLTPYTHVPVVSSAGGVERAENWRWKLNTQKVCCLYLQMSVDLRGNICDHPEFQDTLEKWKISRQIDLKVTLQKMRTLLHLCCSKCCEPSTLHPWKVMSHSQKWLYVHTWLIHTFSRVCNLYVSVTSETWLYDAYMTHLHLKALCDGLGAYRMGDCMWHTRETWLYETWYIPFDMMCSCESWLIHILSSCGLGMVHMGYGMGCLYASHTWDMSLWCIWGTCMCRTYKIWIYETRLIQHDMTR